MAAQMMKQQHVMSAGKVAPVQRCGLRRPPRNAVGADRVPSLLARARLCWISCTKWMSTLCVPTRAVCTTLGGQNGLGSGRMCLASGWVQLIELHRICGPVLMSGSMETGMTR